MIRVETVIDVVKVQCVTWGTVIFTQAGIIQLAETIQAVGSALLVVLSLIYTGWKFWSDYEKRNPKSPTH